MGRIAAPPIKTGPRITGESAIAQLSGERKDTGCRIPYGWWAGEGTILGECESILIKFTADDWASGAPERQARPKEFRLFLDLLNRYNPQAEGAARKAIQDYIATNPAVTAAHIACTGQVKDEWYPVFDPLYYCLIDAGYNDEDAHAEAGKFLGLLVWSEMVNSSKYWHYAKYPKKDADFDVMEYFAMDGYVAPKAKEAHAASERLHGREDKALNLEAAAKALRVKFKKGS